MTRTTLLSLFVAAFALIASVGFVAAIANSTLSTTYASILQNNTPLIQKSLLSEGLVTRISSSNPSNNSWIENSTGFFTNNKTLEEIRKEAQEEYKALVAREKDSLQVKLAQGYVYLRENPTSNARDTLTNTTATIEKQIQSPTTPLSTLQQSSELLSENNQYFQIVVKYEKRKEFLAKARSFLSTTQQTENESAANNQVAIEEVRSILTNTLSLIEIEKDPEFNPDEQGQKLLDLQVRLASAQQVIESEKVRIIAEEKARKEAEEKRLAELAEFARRKPTITFKHIIIDISDQVLYKMEGETVIDSSPVVTGKPGYDTIQGQFSVVSKQRNIVLRSPFPGITYNYPVDYWLAFTNTGFGIHDAYTRSEFGGNIYSWNGSHGCVNTPYNFVADLYSWADMGSTVQVRQ